MKKQDPKREIRKEIIGVETSLESDLFEEEKRLVDPETWAEIDSKIYSEQRWRINGLIPYEGFTILASVAGEKKTWIALEMAKSIALGIDFLGSPNFSTIPGNVLYIDMEMPQSEFQRRGRQLGLKEKEHKIYILNKDDFDLSELEDQLWLFHIIKRFDICTVFVDTLRAVAGGLKEDKAEEVRSFFNEFRQLKNQGVSLVFLDHLRKRSNFEGKIPKKEQLLGSQDKTASVEVLNMIQSEDSSNTIDFYQRKNRLAVEQRPFKILMEDDIDENEKILTVLTYAGEIEDAETKKEEAKKYALNILIESGKSTKELLQIMQSERKIGAKNVRRALKELVDEGSIDYSKDGRQNYYFLVQKEENEDENPITNDESNLF